MNFKEIFKKLNSEVTENGAQFCGDIIITDPCYILKDDDHDIDYDDPEGLAEIGCEHNIVDWTGYGDWSCGMFDAETGVKYGDFCADAGLVTVLLLDEVLKYNPDFKYHIERPWTTTLIENFCGTAKIIKVPDEEGYNERFVLCDGVDSKTGNKIQLVSFQTGF